MSDTSQGPGWWLASDGQWYAPDSELQVAPGWTQGAEGEWVAPGSTGDGALPGWWIGTDGTWYTPSIHPQPPEPLPEPELLPEPEPSVGAASEDGPSPIAAPAGSPSPAAAVASVAASSAWKSAFVPGQPGTPTGSTPPSPQPRPTPAYAPSAPVPAPYGPPYRRVNPCAILSLVFGLIVPMPLGAIVFGAIAIEQINESNGRERGKALAAWGIIFGFITAIVMVLILLSLSRAASCDPSYQSC